MDMYQIFCMFVDRLYQTSTKQFLFDHLKAILHISELDLFWVSFRGLPVDCLVGAVPFSCTFYLFAVPFSF